MAFTSSSQESREAWKNPMACYIASISDRLNPAILQAFSEELPAHQRFSAYVERRFESMQSIS